MSFNQPEGGDGEPTLYIPSSQPLSKCCAWGKAAGPDSPPISPRSYPFSSPGRKSSSKVLARRAISRNQRHRPPRSLRGCPVVRWRPQGRRSEDGGSRDRPSPGTLALVPPRAGSLPKSFWGSTASRRLRKGPTGSNRQRPSAGQCLVFGFAAHKIPRHGRSVKHNHNVFYVTGSIKWLCFQSFPSPQYGSNFRRSHIKAT